MTSEPSEIPEAEVIEGENAASEATPTLNRAERRAQAKGKKPAPVLNNRGGFQQGGSASGNRTAAFGGRERIPRTGHK